MGSVLVYDSAGLYISLAERLTKEFETVYYFCDWKGAEMFPKSYKKNLGQGIPNVVRLDSFQQGKYLADFIFFPDCQHGDEQMDLQVHSIPCFGGGSATKLENNRRFFKEKLEGWNLPVGEYEIENGIDNLMENLEKKDLSEPVFVKISDTRGDMETKGVKDIVNARSYFAKKKLDMGINGDTRDFIIEKYLEGLECGIDTICVRGQMIKKVQFGVEGKDVSYYARMVDIDSLPKGMKDINDKISEYIKENNVSTFVCTENRINNRKFYFTDATIRCGLPPIEMQMTNWINLGEMLRDGANGICTEPKYQKEYACQLILTLQPKDEVIERELRVTFDKKYKDNIHFYNYCMKDGDVYIIPMKEVGHNICCSVVGLGDTFQEAKEQLYEIASTIDTDYLNMDKHAFDDMDEEIAEAESEGIDMFM